MAWTPSPASRWTSGRPGSRCKSPSQPRGPPLAHPPQALSFWRWSLLRGFGARASSLWGRLPLRGVGCLHPPGATADHTRPTGTFWPDALRRGLSGGQPHTPPRLAVVWAPRLGFRIHGAGLAAIAPGSRTFHPPRTRTAASEALCPTRRDCARRLPHLPEASSPALASVSGGAATTLYSRTFLCPKGRACGWGRCGPWAGLLRGQGHGTSPT